MNVVEDVIFFDWDQGNRGKPGKHAVTNEEAEEAFFDPHKKVSKDALHSATEDRYILLGKSKVRRLLYIVFTWRKTKIRIISVRDINKKEVHLYEKAA